MLLSYWDSNPFWNSNEQYFNFTFDYYFSAGDTFSLLNFFAGSVSSLEAGIITITYLTY